MKIAIIGYGKMGQAIERIARERNHEISIIIDEHNREMIDSEEFVASDIAIEFTQPDSAIGNYHKVFATGVPLVSGTTGWGSVDSLREDIEKANATFFWSSNFSVGVNIFFALNRYLARIMNRFEQYTPSMHEVHHIHKLDHPSGTAKTLAEGIIAETAINSWTEESNNNSDQLFISHAREGEVPGIHTVTWDSPLDSITITHSAKSRDSFALGAVIAAEWAHNRRGILTMEMMMGDLLKSTL